MATIVLGAIGTLIGGPIGGAIGSLIGSAVDSRIFAPGPREGPRLNELKITTSSYGMAIPRHFGRMRVPGQIIWSTDLVEHKESQGGGKGSPSVTTYSYSASFAVALSSRPLLSVGRVWADGKLLRGAGGDLKVGGRFRFHAGYGDQRPDPLIAAAEGASRCPAYRGTAYVVFEDLDLSDYGNRIPSLSFEVIGDDGPLSLSAMLDGVLPDSSAPVSLGGIAGWSVDGSLAETLATLQPLIPMDLDVSDGQLMLLPEDSDGPVIPLPPPSTASNQDDFGRSTGFTKHRGAAPETPVRVLRYYDLERDYQPGAQGRGACPSRPAPDHRTPRQSLRWLCPAAGGTGSHARKLEPAGDFLARFPARSPGPPRIYGEPARSKRTLARAQLGMARARRGSRPDPHAAARYLR